MKYVISFTAAAVFLAFAALQIAAGYVGIEHGIGLVWAVVAVAAALLMRITLPISIGAFFGAMHAWGWHWPAALAFSAPGLIFVLPGVIPAIFSLVRQGSTNLTRATPICAEH